MHFQDYTISGIYMTDHYLQSLQPHMNNVERTSFNPVQAMGFETDWWKAQDTHVVQPSMDKR